MSYDQRRGDIRMAERRKPGGQPLAAADHLRLALEARDTTQRRAEAQGRSVAQPEPTPRATTAPVKPWAETFMRDAEAAGASASEATTILALCDTHAEASRRLGDFARAKADPSAAPAARIAAAHRTAHQPRNDVADDAAATGILASFRKGGGRTRAPSGER